MKEMITALKESFLKEPKETILAVGTIVLTFAVYYFANLIFHTTPN
jgi:hypothetical protein